MTSPSWYADALAGSASVDACGIFFVVGCQKSGTTWVAHALDAHPEITCRGEGHLTDVLAPLLEQAIATYNAQGKTNGKLPREDLFAALRLLTDQTLRRYLDSGADPRRTRFLGDKTPEAAVNIPLLDALYPGARFLHIIRDGRDGAVSGWAHLQRLGQAGAFASFDDYAAYFAKEHWKHYIERARAAGAAMPDRYLEIRYEAMLDDPQGQMRRMLELLGADASDAAVDACVAGGSFEKLSGGRARGEESPGSHFRKGVAGEWASHFDATTTERFEAEAGDLLETLGYAGAACAAPMG